MELVNASKTDALYMQLNAAELTAIIMKDSPNSNDRDAGFCSASSESEGGDDLALEHAPHNIGPSAEPAEAKPMALVRNKRKSTEPSKVVESSASSSSSSSTSSYAAAASATRACSAATGPLKKRIRYTSSADSAVVLTPPALNSPPPMAAHGWDASQVLPHELMPNPAHIYVRHPGVTTLHRSYASQPEQQEPLALVLKKPVPTSSSSSSSSNFPKEDQPQSTEQQQQQQQQQQPLPLKQQTPKKCSSAHKKLPRAASVAPLELDDELDEELCPSSSVGSMSRPQQRNYKNMTRERRIEANARERTRVHTISAAYETLRHAVPAYASSQKLSKLSVLRVACSYILTLSRMAGEDYSADQSEPSIADCIDAVTSTIQTEGKVKRKKDE